MDWSGRWLVDGRASASRSRVGTMISVGQAYIGAEGVLYIVFTNLDYKLTIGYFCIDFDCCFQSREENETLRALQNRGFNANNLPSKALISTL